jgi:hypothetical protein
MNIYTFLTPIDEPYCCAKTEKINGKQHPVVVVITTTTTTTTQGILQFYSIPETNQVSRVSSVADIL